MRYYATMETLIRILRRIGHGVIVAIAVLWFFLDVLFLSLVRPLRDHITRWWWVQKMHTWVCTLGPYGSLAVFAIPLLLLEPVKPIGALLFHHGHHKAAVWLIVAGELLKLTIVDQLFEMTKPKLMTFRWFVWVYGKIEAVLNTLRNLPIRQMVHRWFRRLMALVSQ